MNKTDSNSIWQDLFFTPHIKVKRNWIRRPTLFFSAPLLFVICAIVGVFYGITKLFRLTWDYFLEVWKGE